MIPAVAFSDRAGNTQQKCFMPSVNCLPTKKGPQVGKLSAFLAEPWLTFWGEFPLQALISTNILRHKPAKIYVHCFLISLLHGDRGGPHLGEGWVYHVVIPKELDFLNCSNIEPCIKFIGMGRAWFENPPWNKEIETFPCKETSSNDR